MNNPIKPGSFTTTTQGAPVASDNNSLTVGADGPIVLHDAYTVEKLAQFNRERVPERVVHAKGTGAFGVFETTEDVSKYTRAALFQPGVSTEMLIRFSTVAGEQDDPTPGVTPAVLRSSSTPPRVTTTWSVTTPPSSSSATPSSSPTSSTPRSVCPATACATTTCSGTSGACAPSQPTR